jgi:O-antigen/teichoic acid export membrane protein
MVSASSLVGVLANLGLGAGLVRFVPEAGEKAGRLINASFTLTGGLALAGSLIYLASAKYWSPALDFVRGNACF